MFTVTQKFTQRLLPLALVFTVLGGMALVAYFAPNLVEYFASSSGSSTPLMEFYLAPIVRAPLRAQPPCSPPAASGQRDTAYTYEAAAMAETRCLSIYPAKGGSTVEGGAGG
jgi:hypothetical protein